MQQKIYDIAVIGLGPAGIGILKSLRNSHMIASSICFERGPALKNKTCSAIENQRCCTAAACHIISGVGGASSLSNGKLSLFPAGSGLARFFDSEQELVEMMTSTIAELNSVIGLKKADVSNETIHETHRYYDEKGITYKFYDVYDFDGTKFHEFIEDAMESFELNGLEVHLNAEVTKVLGDSHNKAYALSVSENGRSSLYLARRVVFASGASEVQESVLEDLAEVSQEMYEVGVRIECPSDSFIQVFKSHGDLKLKYGKGRTFCVTKDGSVVSYRTNDISLLEGYTDQANKTEYSNLAILIETDEKSDFCDFLRRYRTISGGIPIRQKYHDYLQNKQSNLIANSTLAVSCLGNINELFPASINQQITEFIKHVVVEGMKLEEEKLVLIAPELKLIRKLELSKDFEIAKNLYVVGAATGRFRGVLQSYCSGLKCGMNISSR